MRRMPCSVRCDPPARRLKTSRGHSRQFPSQPMRARSQDSAEKIAQRKAQRSLRLRNNVIAENGAGHRSSYDGCGIKSRKSMLQQPAPGPDGVLLIVVAHEPLANPRQTCRAGDCRRLALDREALIVWYVHVALGPDQPDATVQDGAFASVDSLAVVLVDRFCDL